jgi:hypothetical protein
VPIWLVQQPSSRRSDWASMGADGIHVMDYWQGSSRFLWERDGGRAG